MNKTKLRKKRSKSPRKRSLTIITTHVNADFDALASLLAAQKLYPGALIVFPGSQEKNLRNFFIQSMVYLFNIAEIKDIDFQAVKKLVLVDTSRSDRIGRLSEVLSNPGLTIHIYDHHPKEEDDIQGHHEIRRNSGATVTILTQLLRSKKIQLTSEEATIMCLGIYEDTGSFSFSSTTAEDLEAAAFLVTRGANINIIASMIAREISPEQVSYLNDLIQASSRHLINGIEIVVTRAVFDHYLPDFAFLVHKMVKIEDIGALFALVMMENKVYVVARSRHEDVDVGNILKALGGGGHATAASASIKERTLAQVEQDLFQELHAQIQARRQARHLMSSPPIIVESTILCNEAKSVLTRYNVNALLVIEKNRDARQLVGYITRQVVEKAIFHDLGHVPVGDYMTTEIAHVSPEADLIEVQEKIIDNKQRILPVMGNGTILGVITRTDLLNILVHQSRLVRKDAADPEKNIGQTRTRHIANFLHERLASKLYNLLVRAGRTADRLGFECYVVGGFVRDLFLYRTNEDIDLVIEGDGIAFARALAAQTDARIHTHTKFGTAVIIFKDGFKIDVASARLEYYKYPAALPDVEMSSIKLDLFRRDFTVNTLAIHLNPGKFGRLIDFFSAQKDIKDRAIRVLHNLSFVEDPTRVFRAIRFEQRFGFSIGKLTSSLIENAVRMDFFKRLSGRRVISEIKLILEEENPVAAITRMQDYNILKVIHPTIVLDNLLKDLLNAAKSVIAWHDLLFIEEPYSRWLIYFMVLIHHCDLDTSISICKKMGLNQKATHILGRDRLNAQQRLISMEQRLPQTAGDLYHHLAEFDPELILYMMTMTHYKNVKKAISTFYNQLRHVNPTINGNDLKTLGINPGPIYKQILKAVLDAKLEGGLVTWQDEMKFVRRWLQSRTSNKSLDSEKLSQ